MAIPNAQLTVEEYHRLGQGGILTEDDRVELLDGKITTLTPIGVRHAGCVNRLSMLLQRYVGESLIVSTQNPVRLSDHSEPQPDVALVRPGAGLYTTQHPGPADILLLVEVADTSLDQDRGMKLALYARASIPEVWIVDLTGEVVETYAQPRDAQYLVRAQAGRGASVVAHTLPGLRLAVDAILG